MNNQKKINNFYYKNLNNPKKKYKNSIILGRSLKKLIINVSLMKRLHIKNQKICNNLITKKIKRLIINKMKSNFKRNKLKIMKKK